MAATTLATTLATTHVTTDVHPVVITRRLR
jgi:hypothetical protein